jgi:hypothetical protein
MNSASDRLRRLGVLVLVLAIALQPAVGGAMAAPDDDGPCGGPTHVYGERYSAATNAAECQDLKDAQPQGGNATWADIYASGLALNDLEDSTTTNILNHLEDARTIAKMEAKAEAVREFKNGTNRSAAKADVNQTIADYYATLQSNAYESHRAQINQIWYNMEAANQSGVHTDAMMYNQSYQPNYNGPGKYPVLEIPGGTSKYWDFDNSNKVYDKENITVPLVNGTTMTLPVINQTATDLNPGHYGELNPYNLTTSSNDDVTAVYALNPDYFAGNSPTSTTQYNSSSVTEMYDQGEYLRLTQEIQNQSEEIQLEAAGNPPNATSYVDALYNTYDSPSDLNVTEVLSPIELAREWNTNLNTTGNYGWLAAEYGLTTLNGSVGTSFAIEYTPRSNHTRTKLLSLNGSGNQTYAFTAGETYNMSGTLFADAGSLTFQPNETYDTANFTGVVFIEQLQNGSRAVELNGTFTVTALSDPSTGESLNQTSLVDQTYDDFDADSTDEQLRRLANYRDTVTNSYDSGGGGGGGGLNFGFNLGMAGIGGIAILLGGAYLVTSGASKAS